MIVALLIGTVGAISWLSTAYLFHRSTCLDGLSNISHHGTEVIHRAEAEVVGKAAPIATLSASAKGMDSKGIRNSWDAANRIKEEEEANDFYEKNQSCKVTTYATALKPAKDSDGVVMMTVLCKHRQIYQNESRHFEDYFHS
jgi:hypothetical protein